MITQATGRPVQTRLRPAELREGEIDLRLAQGPVPACLLRGYEPPPAVVRLPDPPAEPEPSCAFSAPSFSVRKTHPGTPKLPPTPEVKPLGDVEARRALVEQELAGGEWRTAWEIARATGLHPEVVRTILRSSCARSRPVAEEQIKPRGALIEYAAMKPGGEAPEPPPRPARWWTHALCEVCERAVAFREEPIEAGIDLICSACGALIATLYRGNPGRKPEKEKP